MQLLGGNMDFNNLDPNEKLALILFNRKNIRRMRDDIIAITILIAVFGLALVGMYVCYVRNQNSIRY